LGLRGQLVAEVRGALDANLSAARSRLVFVGIYLRITLSKDDLRRWQRFRWLVSEQANVDLPTRDKSFGEHWLLEFFEELLAVASRCERLQSQTTLPRSLA
jgi:hypothetical protein